MNQTTTEALKLLCAWTIGKPEEADEFMMDRAVETVRRVQELAQSESAFSRVLHHLRRARVALGPKRQETSQ